ncbi:pectinesterase family protein [Phytohabitans sp. ZYX-F-186]|uniref:Pectinesterase n=1 Tax=Phytohabitans maris TaxID=3071409 RepID=A0ABU0ZED1_9ACTN|nr:pectinesterase family protein [Phytohabitans sp. ZYX-F-186]MDQ7905397.1 pectinesterase family protein [Phytohabitans sp. ZYX-F-186]
MSNRLTLGAAVIGLAVPTVIVAVSVLPASAATPANGGVYTLAVGASGKCLEVAGGSADNGALLQQASCSAGSTRQQWRVVSSSAGGFNLVNVNSTRCADLPSGSTSSGVQLQQWGCGDGTKVNQRWSFAASSAASGKYRITSAASGLCVSDRDGSTAGGNPIVQETCSDVARMQWLFNQVGGNPNPTTPPPSGTPTVASDGTGTYRTVQAAIDAVPANNSTRRVITIKAGTYREVIRVPSNKPLVTLQGLGSGPSNVVIVYNNSAGTHGTSGSATAFVDGRDFVATNLTISNDFDENSASSGHQAVALNLNADRAVLDNVRLLGDQDTFLVNDATRAYVADSYVEGTVDFIFGGGTIVFDNCSIYEKRSTGGPITAASTAATKTYGFLFYRSSISGAANNVTQLGRPWRPDAQVLYRESTLSATIRTAQPWTDMSGNVWQNARFLEYRNTGSGAGTNANRPQLSDSQAANYTPQRYLAGSDGWNPM